MYRACAIAVLLFAMLGLQACGTLYATAKSPRGDDVMLLGHDPVAYFTDGRPTRGSNAITTTLPGRTYYFASAQHKQLFDASPAKYEPQYGGFCSDGAAFARPAMEYRSRRPVVAGGEGRRISLAVAQTLLEQGAALRYRPRTDGRMEAPQSRPGTQLRSRRNVRQSVRQTTGLARRGRVRTACRRLSGLSAPHLAAIVGASVALMRASRGVEQTAHLFGGVRQQPR